MDRSNSSRRLTAADLMSSPVLTVPLDTALDEVSRLFARAGISGAPVVDHEGNVVGVISKTDLARPLHDRDVGVPPGDARVHDVYSPYTFTASPDTDVEALARIMERNQIHRLLIVKGSSLVGIVTATDLASHPARAARPQRAPALV